MKASGQPGAMKNTAPKGAPWTMWRWREELDEWRVWFDLVSRVDWLNDSQLSEHGGMLDHSGWFRLESRPTDGGGKTA
jgi:hypothetical protein